MSADSSGSLWSKGKVDNVGDENLFPEPIKKNEVSKANQSTWGSWPAVLQILILDTTTTGTNGGPYQNFHFAQWKKIMKTWKLANQITGKRTVAAHSWVYVW